MLHLLSSLQRNTLGQILGIEEGYCYEYVRDYPGCDIGTKILYLERAMSQDCQTYLTSLDKLYISNLQGQARTDHLEFIKALKLINDLCFNNPVSVSDSRQIKNALDYYFGQLGPFNTDNFISAVKQLINLGIEEFSISNRDLSLQKAARLSAEENLPMQTGWRNELHLPDEQLPRSAPDFFENIEYSSKIQMRETLTALESKGLTAWHLIEWHLIYKIKFEQSHRECLIDLISKMHLPANEAMEVISNLNGFQAETYLRLNSSGITADLLRSWVRPSLNPLCIGANAGAEQREFIIDFYTRFTHAHKNALIYLMTQGQPSLSANEAILAINNLNEHQVSALEKLHQFGLTGEQLRQWQGIHFGDGHVGALVELIQNNAFTPQQAMTEIRNLNNDQAKALVNLKPFGMTGDLLRSWQRNEFNPSGANYPEVDRPFINDFDSDHTSTLYRLMVRSAEPVTAHVAIQAINQLNFSQCRALFSLNEKGLTGDHLRSWIPGSEAFGRGHEMALVHLMTREESQLAPAEAVQSLNGLSVDEAYQLVNVGQHRNGLTRY